MSALPLARFLALLGGLLLCASRLPAQGTAADYERSANLRERFQTLLVGTAENISWLDDSTFWYRRTVKGGAEFVLVNASARTKRPAFDHQRIAAALTTAMARPVSPIDLPFRRLEYVDDHGALEFEADSARWRCTLSSYVCERRGPPRPPREREPDADVLRMESPWETEYWSDELEATAFPRFRQQAQGRGGQERQPSEVPSPDSQLEASIRNFNVFLRAIGEEDWKPLSTDGSEGDAYQLGSIRWSPDSRRLVAYRRVPGYDRQVHYIESSPEDQIQPKHSTRSYRKPGDRLDVDQPVLFDVTTGNQIVIDRALFPNAYNISRPRWLDDGHGFRFDYNQRGHQVYRVLEVEAATGRVRAVIDERMPTFVNYSQKRHRTDIADGSEIIWISERDGWNHLYLYDGTTGRVKNQITRGEWVVRQVLSVDTVRRQILFTASGMHAGKDPYLVHHYRVGFDGTGLTPLTEADGTHSLTWSPDSTWFVDTWSRVDLAPISELRRARDRSLVMELERGDVSELMRAGWRAPEPFVASGRDGRTGIWGVIFRPTNFDPRRTYPVIENIYAGPQGAFVPKSFMVTGGMQALAELGFIVVQIDGMGTSHRSKAFHDVAWRNLGDAGFPDRIRWHQAVAATYSWYDTSRVGIYGTSAGAQSALGGLLFHGAFYDAAVAAAGCHDNRMDKIWWNEQWMGWPIGPHYAASSNVDHAHQLQGRLLLVVGELDTNVDPSSTLQVVDALIEADKVFDLLVLPGQGHTAGGAYGIRKRNDFFVQHLLGVTPPERNASVTATDGNGGR